MTTESLAELRELEEKLRQILRREEMAVTTLRDRNFSQTVESHFNGHRYATALSDRRNSIESNSNEEDFTRHIKKFMPVDIFVNRIEFSLDTVHRMPNDSKIFSIHGNARHVSFSIRYCWNEKEGVSDIEVDFLKPFHKCELASQVNNCIRQNNLQHLTKTLVSYADKCLVREAVLRNLSSKYNRIFTYNQLESKGCYKMEVKSDESEICYFEATWLCMWYAPRNSMDHSFNIIATEEGKVLAELHTPALMTLINKAYLTAEDITDTFSELIEACIDLEQQ